MRFPLGNFADFKLTPSVVLVAFSIFIGCTAQRQEKRGKSHHEAVTQIFSPDGPISKAIGDEFVIETSEDLTVKDSEISIQVSEVADAKIPTNSCYIAVSNTYEVKIIRTATGEYLNDSELKSEFIVRLLTDGTLANNTSYRMLVDVYNGITLSSYVASNSQLLLSGDLVKVVGIKLRYAHVIVTAVIDSSADTNCSESHETPLPTTIPTATPTLTATSASTSTPTPATPASTSTPSPTPTVTRTPTVTSTPSPTPTATPTPLPPVVTIVGGNTTINEDAGNQTKTITWTGFNNSGVVCGGAGNTLSFSSDNAALVANGSASFSSTSGSCVLTYSAGTNKFGTANLTVTVSDGALTANRSFQLTVTHVNHAPTLTSITTLTGATQDRAFTVSYTTLAAASNIADVDVSDTLRFRIEAVSTGTLTKSGVSVTPGTTLLASGESLVWTPAAASAGTLNAFTVKAWDGNDASTTAVQVRAGTAILSCPTGYLLIYYNSDLGSTDFCVMKYEAKNVSGVATSQAAGAPWVNVLRGTSNTQSGSAWKACASLGTGYDLISNIQWQAVARNIETVASNWSLGDSSGTHAINRGHSDDSGSASYLAASTDNDPCYGTGNTHCTDSSHADFTQKRTHTLVSGEIIWDLAGNVWEWVQDTFSTVQGGYEYVSQLTSPTYDLLNWGTAGNYVATKNSGEYGGFGKGFLGSSGSVMRGGYWFNGTDAGIFASYLGNPLTWSGNSVGFRCTVTPTRTVP